MKRFGIAAILALVAATAMFYAAVHQISGLWLDVALNPQISSALQQSLGDQKLLRELDPGNSRAYRERFEATRRLLARLGVIRMSRTAMLRRFEIVVVSLFAAAAAILLLVAWSRYRGAQQRERRLYIERLSAWQETARRLAHEIKGPLTAARLELERLGDLARRGAPASDLARAEESIAEELERLTSFTREFSSFGTLNAPVLRSQSLRAIVEEFCATFGGAWPSLALDLSIPEGHWPVCADRDLIRQVLVNLCTNSSHAVNDRGTATLSIRSVGDRTVLDVRDNGSGISPALRPRIFDPYVTTRRIGSGMGLGLAISRKIMLDHGGDLELVDTSPAGTTFRLTFGDAECL